MRFWFIAAACAAGLSGCSEQEPSEPQQQADIDKAVAEVEAAQTPPPDVVTPQRITSDQRERYKFSPNGCDFAVNAPELGALAILQLNVGYMQFEGEIERFAPDAGAGEGPFGTSLRYNSGRHVLRIEYVNAQGKPQGSQATSYPARLELQDGRDRTVYVAEGVALCST
ncbi:hypothetical protein [Qipengyuania sp.]|uniref:hypothetical protein n=1 Tax=Qipengyuania sp. TaxID=2004515 RepID=UPI0035C839F5